MKRLLILALFLCALPAAAQFLPVEPNPYGGRSVIIPVPSEVCGNPADIVTLDSWYYKHDAGEGVYWFGEGIPADFDEYEMEEARWAHFTPPHITAFMQEATIPSSFEGKRTVIRFDGTTHYSQLYVNGRYVRDHWGSYGSWTADITDFVAPGEKALIALRMDQRPQGLAAFVRFSGNIYESTRIYALPENYIERLRIDTDLDAEYTDADLGLWIRLREPSDGFLKLSLRSPSGRKVKLPVSHLKLPAGMQEFKCSVPVRNPLKWDSEHPDLYKLELTLCDARGRELETLSRNVGFRKIEQRGRRLYVNGQEVKFRGIWGVDDARTLRELNANHVRHKYMTEARLDSCDVYGIYVLHENSVDFAKFRGGQSPEYGWQWTALLADMMERDGSHPSVVMWGLGNESFNDDFTLSTHKYAKFDDPSRPTMFSWSNRVSPDEEIPYDVFSFHYGSFGNPDFNPATYGTALWHSSSLIELRNDDPQMPVLFDESTHVCISREEAARDPNVRNFWGESIKYCWEKCWRTDGVLGMDQFGIFTDLGNWDMPEQWLTRKAYSPFVIAADRIPVPEKGIEIQVENRFCHTDLSEIKVEWSVGSENGTVYGPKAGPRETGVLSIPCKKASEGDTLRLAAYRSDGSTIDEYAIPIGENRFKLPAPSQTAPRLKEENGFIYVSGEDFKLVFDRYAGQITSLQCRGEEVLCGGPYLHILRSGLSLGEFWPQSVSASIEGNEAVIDMDVIYSPIEASLSIRIDGNGLMNVGYTVKHIPDAPPVAFSIPWNRADIGGYSEIGVAFALPGDVDRLKWDRKALWTTYPDDHIGRPTGVACRNVEESAPGCWSALCRDFDWMGGRLAQSDVTNDFRSSKEYIRSAVALRKGLDVGVQALSQEKDAVRLEYERWSDQVLMYINNEWNYPTLGVGNYMKAPLKCEAGYTGSVTLRPYAGFEAKTVKSVSILGDSYSTFEGYVPDGNAIWYYTPVDTARTDISRVEQTWWWQLTHSEGYSLCANDSYSGATVSYTGYYDTDYADRSFITRMPRLGNPDIILIFGAINDSWTGVGMGEYKYDGISREDLYLFRPAFAKMLSECRRLYPDAQTYFILSDDLRTEINDSTQKICAHYGVSLIRLKDIDKKCGHPTVRGMEQIKNQILENIQQ